MFKEILNSFKANTEDVERLVNFDREVLQLVILSLQDLHEKLKPHHGTPQMNGGRVLEMIIGIRDNESLRDKYGVIFNQAVVLLVSYFSSALGDIFRAAVILGLDNENNSILLDEEIKLTFKDMKERDWNMKSAAADLLIAKKDYTFQDMQSTVRAFDTYVGINLVRDEITNSIILGQAARHVIVHAGGIATERFMKQISKAYPRTLKPNMQLNDKVQFTAKDVTELKGKMLAYINNVVAKVEAAQIS